MERYGRSTELLYTSSMFVRSERTHVDLLIISNRRSLHVGFLFFVFFFERSKEKFFFCFVRFSSAGVGRTGTFITLDAMIEKMKHEGSINVWDFIRQMRTERQFMVQTTVSRIDQREKITKIFLRRNNTHLFIERF